MTIRLQILLLFASALASHSSLAAQVDAARPIEPAGAVAPTFEESIRAILRRAIERGDAPGAVCAIGDIDGPWLSVAEGGRSVTPDVEDMTTDTVFDAASLTKCVVTTTGILRLLDAGKLSLEDPLSKFLPELKATGFAKVTIDDVMRHRAGYIADNKIADYRDGPAEARRRILALEPIKRTGPHYLYSDVGFIVLGYVIEAISDMRLDEFARTDIFEPLGMRDSRYVRSEQKPDAPWLARVAPTEPAKNGEPPLRGVVHDPRARAMEGVAGHAGLFTTAADLSRFAAMLAREGRLEDGRRYLACETIARMRNPGDLAPAERRGLGFDMRPPNDWSNRPGGTLFPLDGYGHTGFTGTSLWIDPRTKSYVILLTSRLHPNGKGDVTAMRREIGDAAARGLRDRPWPLPDDPKATVRTGLDRVAAGYWPKRFQKKRVGLITNHTGRDVHGRSAIDILRERKDLTLVRLFSPEHGIRGAVDAEVADDVDAASGLPITSLYGKTRRPSSEMLEGLDVLVFDIQDIGTRFYTYVSTMVWAMEEAAAAKKAFVVLDRPNPIGGTLIEGPLADLAELDFVGAMPIPVRHGATIGELALWYREWKKLDLDLEVVTMTGWRRAMLFDETGLEWVNPSPNMRSLDEALLYPGIGLLETTNVSVGRGTATPFEVLGAPWLDAKKLLDRLGTEEHPGVTITTIDFTPDASVHVEKLCHGLRFEITDRRALRPVALGLALARALRETHEAEWDRSRLNRLLKVGATDLEKLGDVRNAAWSAPRLYD